MVQPGSAEALPFRRSDAALLAPFAALLGLHLRASQRYQQLKELLVGLTRSLTAAIDTKDSYTYGHSERSRTHRHRAGRELGLQEDELSDIYLAGLMHDVGKIGIRDDVLSKAGASHPRGDQHVRQHVTIGYRILAGLHPISHLLPGVLYHHERYDGRGYPEGLKGDAIPFLAHILAVADSFDAMSTSPVSVRDAQQPRRSDPARGGQTQWDRKVIDAYFRCRERVQAIRQRGVGGESSQKALIAPCETAAAARIRCGSTSGSRSRTGHAGPPCEVNPPATLPPAGSREGGERPPCGPDGDHRPRNPANGAGRGRPPIPPRVSGIRVSVGKNSLRRPRQGKSRGLRRNPASTLPSQIRTSANMPRLRDQHCRGMRQGGLSARRRLIGSPVGHGHVKIIRAEVREDQPDGPDRRLAGSHILDPGFEPDGQEGAVEADGDVRFKGGSPSTAIRHPPMLMSSRKAGFTRNSPPSRQPSQARPAFAR